MHTIFSVAAKLFGIYFLYLGAMYLVSALAYADEPFATALAQLPFAIIAFAFGFVLALRTAWLAGVLGVSPDESASRGGFEPEVVLRTGIILVGLYVFTTDLDQVVGRISMHLQGVGLDGMRVPWVDVAIECLPLAIALFLVFGANRVLDLIGKYGTGTTTESTLRSGDEGGGGR